MPIVMPTVSEERIMITLRLPKPMAALLEQESKFSGLALATLVRHIIKWHAGKASSRHPEAPEAKIPKRGTEARTVKSALIDQEDADYLDAMAARSGLSRVATLIVVMFAWFGLDPIPMK